MIENFIITVFGKDAAPVVGAILVFASITVLVILFIKAAGLLFGDHK